MDAGCGLALLSIWAVQAGATDVLAVDQAAIELATALAEENGCSETIRFLAQDLNTLECVDDNDRFDVIMAMVYLNDPRRDEGQSKLAFSLKNRLLKPQGLMIPSRVEYHAFACDWISQDLPTRHGNFGADVSALEERYGVKMQSLSRALRHRPTQEYFPDRRPDGKLVRPDARLLSDSKKVAVIDYEGDPTGFPEVTTFQLSGQGFFNTVLFVQKLYFRDQLIFSNESVSWVSNPALVSAGDTCKVYLDDEWRQDNVLRILN